MKPFLITGLPRSRTAWWSVAATTPVSTCIHEPLKHCKSFADIKACWDRPGTEYAGVSDSGFVSQLGRILAEVKPRTIIVHRNIDDVERSLEAYFHTGFVDKAAGRAYLEECAAHIAQHRAHPLVRNVTFEALQDLSVIEDCFDWIMPEPRPQFMRELMHMNIQVDRDYALACASVPSSQWYRAA